MLMLSRRLQILLDQERYDRLAAEAARRQVPVALVVREAIDAVVPPAADARRTAADRILSAERMELPSVAELRRELDAVRAGEA
jgi:hypothetical protein